MIKALFRTLDAHPGLYGLVGLLVTAWVMGRLVWAWRDQPAAAARPFRAWLGLFVLLLAWRWVALFEIRDVGATETRLLAGALAARQDPLPFHSVDLLDDGPVAALFLLPTHWLGIPLDYFNARVVALLCDGGALLAAYAFLRARFRPEVAFLGLLPLVLWLAVVTQAAVAGYSAAHVILLLAAVGGWLLWRPTAAGLGPVRFPTLWAFGTGLALGLLPWVSPGGAIVAAVLWCAAALGCARGAGPDRFKRVGRIAGVAGYVTLAMIAFLHGSDRMAGFLVSYLRYNLSAVGDWWWHPANLGHWTIPQPAIWILPAGLLAAGLLLPWRSRRRPSRELAVAAFCAVVVGIYCAGIKVAGREIFWAASFGLCLAVVIGEIVESATNRQMVGKGVAAFGLLLVGGLTAGLALGGPPAIIGHLGEYWRSSRGTVARRILTIVQPGDTMAIWGSGLSLHIETALPQGVSASASPRDFTPSPWRDTFFRSRFLMDLQAASPAVFVDTSLSGTPELATPDAIPALADWLLKNYRFWFEENGMRVYLRADRDLPLDRQWAKAVPITLKTLRVLAVLGEAADAGQTRIIAHPPSRLAQAVPRGARGLSGEFGFFPAAYANASQATDGAHFVIESVDRDGHRHRRFERWLRPVTVGRDRGPGRFALELGEIEGDVEFIIEPGEGGSYDWVYWGELQFEFPKVDADGNAAKE